MWIVEFLVQWDTVSESKVDLDSFFYILMLKFPNTICCKLLFFCSVYFWYLLAWTYIQVLYSIDLCLFFYKYHASFITMDL